eukprot:3178571-Lingulodinium_polyedra.AAC.1
MGCSLVKADGPARFSAVEELLEQRPNPGDTNGSADKHHLLDAPLINATDAQALLDRTRRAPEVVHVQALGARAPQ